ncbi:MAG: lysostaphin resistance A-like protein [Candidatus Sulfotelmatobacter sp.]
MSPSSPAPQPWGRSDRHRMLAFLAIAFVAPLPLAIALGGSGKSGNSSMTVPHDLPLKLVTAFCVLLATWTVARMEKRPMADYGISLRQSFGRRFWEGAFWGFAMLSALLLPLRMTGDFRIDSAALAGSAVVRWAFAWGLTFLGVSLTEELTFRGYFLFLLARRRRFWPAALILSVAFGAAHLGNQGENVFGILQAFGTGLLFCLMIRRTGNLWFAIGYHAAWDWAQTFFYGTPDSGLLGVGRFLNSSVQGPNWLTGGSVGPEGSVFGILILAVCAVVIHFRFPKVLYPNRPM